MLRLVEVDLKTAKARVAIEEAVPRYLNVNVAIYNTPNVRVLASGAEIVWFSEREGWGGLYLYGSDGKVQCKLTAGPLVVFDIIHVDEARRCVYFTGSSQIEKVDPYWRFLYRVSLDGGDPVLLTHEKADHLIDGNPLPMAKLLYQRPAPPEYVSPNGRFIVSSLSTVSMPPVSLLRRSSNGTAISVLECADISHLEEIGFRPPEPFCVKAADGATDLYGVLYWPPNYDPAQSYPIVDAIYNGFQVSVVPHNFLTAAVTPNPYGAAALADLGFIVFTVDARGTAGRSRAFHDHSYRNFGEAGLDDHVAVLTELARRHTSIDKRRAGIYGYSFGGYYSARAMLRHADVYTCAVSGAGCHNWQGMYPGYENLVGPPMFSNGTDTSPDGREIPANYIPLDNASLAANLCGKLMLFIGDLDENVPPAVNFQFADALTKAGKDFELLLLFGETHFSSALHPVVIRKSWDFFVRNLMHAEPPDWNCGGASP
jgi:dienelactone hydrolase